METLDGGNEGGKETKSVIACFAESNRNNRETTRVIRRAGEKQETRFDYWFRTLHYLPSRRRVYS